MDSKVTFHPIVQKLIELIGLYHWEKQFKESIEIAHPLQIEQIKDITNLDEYLKWINEFLYWIPNENTEGNEVFDHLSAFYFILDQEPLRILQNEMVPHTHALALTPFSQWLVDYANAIGVFMDTEISLNQFSEHTFYNSPSYNMRDYIRPNGGWKTFNQFFARNFKPGYRPIAGISDDGVVVSPADSTFAGQWEIRSTAHITLKGLHWQVNELIADSIYKDRFQNGVFMHAFLSPTDYHRQHAPVAGKILEARVIPGQVYLEVESELDLKSNKNQIIAKRKLTLPNQAGYQFVQSRGLIIIESPIGLVAILPIGMSQVSSVIITAEVGVTVRKGEELSYFQFGGSDIVMLFEASSNINITAQPTVHYKMGTKIAQAYPVVQNI